MLFGRCVLSLLFCSADEWLLILWMAGNFAVWGGLFSCFDCTFAAVRKKEDPWNAICAGACTGGLLAARGVCVMWCGGGCGCGVLTTRQLTAQSTFC